MSAYRFCDAADRKILVGSRVIDVHTGQPGGTVTALIEPEDHPARVEVKYDDRTVEVWSCSMVRWDSTHWRCDEIEIV